MHSHRLERSTFIIVYSRMIDRSFKWLLTIHFAFPTAAALEAFLGFVFVTFYKRQSMVDRRLIESFFIKSTKKYLRSFPP